MTPGATVSPEPWTHHHADVNGVRLHLVAAGPEDGPLVLLLHGFPEFWYAWRHQIPALAAAGFRVVAPDLRGYGGSGKPRGVAAYRLSALVGDVAGLVHALGRDRAHVVGHDWGGVIAWATAMRRPDVVDRLAILNAPHPVTYRRELRHNPRQRRRSRYVAFFQVPWLPEWLARRRGYDVGPLLRRTSARPEAFSDEDVARYREALATPGAFHAALNYYRALVRFPGGARARIVLTPTLVLWGERDVALVPELLDGLEGWVPRARVERFPRATHWLQHDEPDTVNARLIEFFRS